jgi:CrcB protein
MPDAMNPANEAVDPDVDLHIPAQRREFEDRPIPVLAVIAIGATMGAAARHGLDLAFPHAAREFAWATFGINVAGCALIGVLMVLVEHVWTTRRLLRPFLGVGVLGGFTTFSTYVVDVSLAVDASAPRVALLYLVAMPVAALGAVWVTATLTRRMIDRRTTQRQPAGDAGDMPRYAERG